MLYNAACVYGVAATAVKADAALAEKYAGRAVALLIRAQAVGYFRNPVTVEHMLKDSDLTSVREREDYKKLLAELGQK